LLETDHPPAFAFALAASPHVETERDVAQFVKHRTRRKDVSRILVAAKTMEDNEGGTPLVVRQILRQTDDPGQTEIIGFQFDAVFRHHSVPGS
jgi:hypothetical protein